MPTIYYAHSKVTISGITRNVTYKCAAVIDCPVTIVLPEIEDDGYGAWFEVQMWQHGEAYSLTLVPPETGGIKIATNSLVDLTKGLNVVDLTFQCIESLLNTWGAG